MLTIFVEHLPVSELVQVVGIQQARPTGAFSEFPKSEAEGNCSLFPWAQEKQPPSSSEGLQRTLFPALLCSLVYNEIWQVQRRDGPARAASLVPSPHTPEAQQPSPLFSRAPQAIPSCKSQTSPVCVSWSELWCCQRQQKDPRLRQVSHVM